MITTETISTVNPDMAAVVAAVDPLRTTITVESNGTGDGFCRITVDGPEIKTLWNKLHPTYGHKFTEAEKLAQPDVHKVLDCNRAIHKAIKRIRAGEITRVSINVWEVAGA